MKLLITGFAPFGGEKINPSWEAVKRLPDSIGSITLEKMEIPVVYGRAAEIVINKAAEIHPDVIICVGQAGGRSAVTPEMVGVNLRYGTIADNEGNLIQDEPIICDAPAAYFSTLPVRSMAKAIEDAGVPAQVSMSAGAYVCNDVLYTLCHRFSGTDIRVGFIHIPFLPQQAKDNAPSLTLEQDITALTAAIKHLDS